MIDALDAGPIPVVILCGGLGTRMGRESVPKALIEIGGRPILWHLMQLYGTQGFTKFILTLGFGGDEIRAAFSGPQPWDIQFVDTGLDTQTGGRIWRLGEMLNGTFMATYVDGLARIDLNELLAHHRRHGRYATVTCAKAQIPFGLVRIGDDGQVAGFTEKPMIEDRVNGGFFAFEPQVLDYLHDDAILEREPFERLAAEGQMTAFFLDEFWACMDTYKDALMLNELWESGAPWKLWDGDRETV